MKYMLAIYRCEINKNIKPETQVNLNWKANATNISAQQYYIKKETHTHKLTRFKMWRAAQ